MPTVVRFHELGGPEVLKIEDAAPQQPGKGELRLRVQAAGLNRAEALFTRGQYLEQPKLPARIGYEVAGVVDAVGEGVDQAWVGKKAATIPGFSMNQYGTLGEQALVPLRAVTEYPSNLTAEQATSVWMQYLTAYGALVLYGNVTKGDYVAIPAASSSVGLAAIQIVRDAGATAIAVTRRSTKKAELLELGAHHVIASEEEDYVSRVMDITGGKGVRITFDPVAGPFVEKLAAAAANEGQIFVYGNLSMQPTPFPIRESFRNACILRAYTLMAITSVPERLEIARKYVYDRLADGRFVPKIAKSFAYKDTSRHTDTSSRISRSVRL
ncbi:zinc-dependent alcohol dehydrogenase family protein [Occallatibacter savannae]|uniref:zinc-dependent alcohol dehydrogenase family protein n=1 Tax=Occallatibacter savannae TaxID=1002691 RepID=UPI001EF61925|nr:zinc-dependent alcohol dehydrogenase family protein [Occallatibacter savannae]